MTSTAVDLCVYALIYTSISMMKFYPDGVIIGILYSLFSLCYLKPFKISIFSPEIKIIGLFIQQIYIRYLFTKHTFQNTGNKTMNKIKSLFSRSLHSSRRHRKKTTKNKAISDSET